MGRIMVLVLVMGLALTLAQAQSAYSVRGRVIESRTREPFAGARVEYVGTHWTRVSYTDEYGRFEIAGLPAGVATVKCEVVGWTGEVYRRQAGLSIGDDSADSVLFVVSYSSLPPITDGLLASWPLDGDASDLWVDQLTGTVEGAKPTTDRHGAIGGAMSFDGTSAITMPQHPGFAALPLTITFWMRVDEIKGDHVFFLGKYVRPSGEGYAMFFENGVLCTGYFRNNFSNWSRVNLYSATDQRWHFFAIRVDQTSLTVFRDDSKMTATAFRTPPSPTTTSEPFRLGKLRSTLTGSATSGLVGAIDDMQVYTRALTDDEVLVLRGR